MDSGIAMKHLAAVAVVLLPMLLGLVLSTGHPARTAQVTPAPIAQDDAYYPPVDLDGEHYLGNVLANDTGTADCASVAVTVDGGGGLVRVDETGDAYAVVVDEQPITATYTIQCTDLDGLVYDSNPATISVTGSFPPEPSAEPSFTEPPASEPPAVEPPASDAPVPEPSASDVPTSEPSIAPPELPEASPVESAASDPASTEPEPSVSDEPSDAPSVASATDDPSAAPTDEPSASDEASVEPSASDEASVEPSVSDEPSATTEPSASPSASATPSTAPSSAADEVGTLRIQPADQTEAGELYVAGSSYRISQYLCQTGEPIGTSTTVTDTSGIGHVYVDIIYRDDQSVCTSVTGLTPPPGYGPGVTETVSGRTNSQYNVVIYQWTHAASPITATLTLRLIDSGRTAVPGGTYQLTPVSCVDNRIVRGDPITVSDDDLDGVITLDYASDQYNLVCHVIRNITPPPGQGATSTFTVSSQVSDDPGIIEGSFYWRPVALVTTTFEIYISDFGGHLISGGTYELTPVGCAYREIIVGRAVRLTDDDLNGRVAYTYANDTNNPTCFRIAGVIAPAAPAGYRYEAAAQSLSNNGYQAAERYNGHFVWVLVPATADPSATTEPSASPSASADPSATPSSAVDEAGLLDILVFDLGYQPIKVAGSSYRVAQYLCQTHQPIGVPTTVTDTEGYGELMVDIIYRADHSVCTTVTGLTPPPGYGPGLTEAVSIHNDYQGLGLAYQWTHTASPMLATLTLRIIASGNTPVPGGTYELTPVPCDGLSGTVRGGTVLGATITLSDDDLDGIITLDYASDQYDLVCHVIRNITPPPGQAATNAITVSYPTSDDPRISEAYFLWQPVDSIGTELTISSEDYDGHKVPGGTYELTPVSCAYRQVVLGAAVRLADDDLNGVVTYEYPNDANSPTCHRITGVIAPVAPVGYRYEAADQPISGNNGYPANQTAFATVVWGLVPATADPSITPSDEASDAPSPSDEASVEPSATDEPSADPSAESLSTVYVIPDDSISFPADADVCLDDRCQPQPDGAYLRFDDVPYRFHRVTVSQDGTLLYARAFHLQTTSLTVVIDADDAVIPTNALVARPDSFTASAVDAGSGSFAYAGDALANDDTASCDPDTLELVRTQDQDESVFVGFDGSVSSGAETPGVFTASYEFGCTVDGRVIFSNETTVTITVMEQASPSPDASSEPSESSEPSDTASPSADPSAAPSNGPSGAVTVTVNAAFAGPVEICITSLETGGGSCRLNVRDVTPGYTFTENVSYGTYRAYILSNGTGLIVSSTPSFVVDGDSIAVSIGATPPPITMTARDDVVYGTRADVTDSSGRSRGIDYVLDNDDIDPGCGRLSFPGSGRDLGAVVDGYVIAHVFRPMFTITYQITCVVDDTVVVSNEATVTIYLTEDASPSPSANASPSPALGSIGVAFGVTLPAGAYNCYGPQGGTPLGCRYGTGEPSTYYDVLPGTYQITVSLGGVLLYSDTATVTGDARADVVIDAADAVATDARLVANPDTFETVLVPNQNTPLGSVLGNDDVTACDPGTLVVSDQRIADGRNLEGYVNNFDVLVRIEEDGTIDYIASASGAFTLSYALQCQIGGQTITSALATVSVSVTAPPASASASANATASSGTSEAPTPIPSTQPSASSSDVPPPPSDLPSPSESVAPPASRSGTASPSGEPSVPPSPSASSSAAPSFAASDRPSSSASPSGTPTRAYAYIEVKNQYGGRVTGESTYEVAWTSCTTSLPLIEPLTVTDPMTYGYLSLNAELPAGAVAVRDVCVTVRGITPPTGFGPGPVETVAGTVSYAQTYTIVNLPYRWTAPALATQATLTLASSRYLGAPVGGGSYALTPIGCRDQIVRGPIVTVSDDDGDGLISYSYPSDRYDQTCFDIHNVVPPPGWSANSQVTVSYVTSNDPLETQADFYWVEGQQVTGTLTIAIRDTDGQAVTGGVYALTPVNCDFPVVELGPSFSLEGGASDDFVTFTYDSDMSYPVCFRITGQTPPPGYQPNSDPAYSYVTDGQAQTAEATYSWVPVGEPSVAASSSPSGTANPSTTANPSSTANPSVSASPNPPVEDTRVTVTGVIQPDPARGGQYDYILDSTGEGAMGDQRRAGAGEQTYVVAYASDETVYSQGSTDANGQVTLDAPNDAAYYIHEVNDFNAQCCSETIAAGVSANFLVVQYVNEVTTPSASATANPSPTAPPSATAPPSPTAPPSATAPPSPTAPPSATAPPSPTAPPSATARPSATAPPSEFPSVSPSVAPTPTATTVPTGTVAVTLNVAVPDGTQLCLDDGANAPICQIVGPTGSTLGTGPTVKVSGAIVLAAPAGTVVTFTAVPFGSYAVIATYGGTVIYQDTVTVNSTQASVTINRADRVNPVPTATATIRPTATTRPTQPPRATATTRPTQTPRPTATPRPPTATPRPTATTRPTSTPRPTATPKPTATPRPPTATPRPTPTRGPTATPRPRR